MKKNRGKGTNKKTTLLWGVIILIIIVAIIIIFLIFKDKNMDSNSTIINDIYRYMGNNDLSLCEGLISYSDDKITYDDLDNSVRICNSYSLLELNDSNYIEFEENSDSNSCSISDNITFATDNYESDICTVTKISSDEVNRQYKKIYGKDITEYEQFQYNDATVCYYEDGYYYCGLALSYTTTIGGEPSTYRSIKEAKQSGEEIIIYDYFLKIVNDKCYTSYSSNILNDDCTDKYESNMAIDYDFLKKYGTLYRHTFKKNGESYYWVESEPVT